MIEPPRPASPVRDAAEALAGHMHAGRSPDKVAAAAFLAGNDLPGRWGARARFVVLSFGFGAGEAFIATWRAWLGSAQRPDRLVFVAIEPHPLTQEDLRRRHADPSDALSRDLCAKWPAATPDMHRLEFEGGRVELLLAVGTVRRGLPALRAEVDAFYLDNMVEAIDVRICKALGRHAAIGATLAARDSPPALPAHLRSAGFVCRPSAPGWLAAAFEPRHLVRRGPGALPATPVSGDRHALIVGAGLAGCALASALAAQGWRSTLLERRDGPARETSGNPAGIFHGTVHGEDGLHTRFNRVAALRVAQSMQLALTAGVRGALGGVLRLEHASSVAQMRALLARLGLPHAYVQALSAEEAGSVAGRTLPSPAWFYPGGGWVVPAELAAYHLRAAGACAQLRTGVDVASIHPITGGWQLRDARHMLLAESAMVVLANAGEAWRLLGEPAWDVAWTRGQLSIAGSGCLTLPRVPVAGSGYLLPEVGGLAIFGASSRAGDFDPQVRHADHVHNIAQLERLIGGSSGLHADHLRGRTAWRFGAYDKLPVVGAVPIPEPGGVRLDQPRLVPRLPGLHVLTALGSRGIAWSILGAQVLAAGIAGAPVPLDAGLIDAIDPARFVSRRARREAAGRTLEPFNPRSAAR